MAATDTGQPANNNSGTEENKPAGADPVTDDTGDDDPTVPFLKDSSTVDDPWKDILTTANLLKDGAINASSGTYSCQLPRFIEVTPATTPPTGPLSFSSEKNKDDFGDDAGSEVPDGHKGVIMGLDTTKMPADYALSDIRTGFGIPNTNLGPVGVILDVVNKLEDKSKNKVGRLAITTDLGTNYNGTWIVPEPKKTKDDPDVLTLTTNLSFTITAEKIKFANDLLGLLKSEFGIDMSKFFSSTTMFTKAKDKPQTTTTGWSIIAKLPNVKGFNLYVGRAKAADAPATGNQEGNIFALTQRDQSTPNSDLSHPGAPAEPSDSKDKLLTDVGNAKSNDAPSDIVPPSNGEAQPTDDSLLGPVRVWYAELNTLTKLWKLAFIYNVKINGKDLQMYLVYDKDPNGDLSGGLWIESSLADSARKLLPDYRDYYDPPANVPKSLDLRHDLGVDVPNGVPFNLSKGNIVYNKRDKSLSLKIAIDQVSSGTSPVPADDANAPAPFDWKDAKFIYKREMTGTTPSTSFSIESNFELHAVDPENHSKELYPPGKLHISLSQKNKVWQLDGTAKDINFGCLVSFFDKNVSKSVMDILGKLKISDLEVKYAYKGKVASSFLFNGTVEFGDLKLSMLYQYASKGDDTQKLLDDELEKIKKGRPNDPKPNVEAAIAPKDKSTWKFDAFLSAQGKNATIKSVIKSIVPDFKDSDLPDFVGDIKLGTNTSAGSTDPNVITISAEKKHIEKKNESDQVERSEDVVAFVFDVKIDIVKFSFIQIGGSGTENGNAIKIGPKKILRLSVGPLPFISNLPVIKELPQPYQLLTYCWVGGEQEVTVEEVDSLNTTYFKDNTEFKLFYKSETRDQKAGLRPGHHFIVINSDSCILDHVFTHKPADNTNKLQALKVKAIAGARAAGAAESLPAGGAEIVAASNDATGGSTPAATEENPPTKGALKKQTQFLSISAISVQYKDETIWLNMDATIKLGPIEFDLIGFGIGVKTKHNGQLLTLNNLGKIAEDLSGWLDFQLHGMAADFDQPPVLIAGVFEHEVTEALDAYRGGIGVKVEPYDFAAVGEYAKVTENGEEYKSVFVYAKLDGPLVDLEIAIIKGVRLGFGYNSFVRSPAVQELKDFPFINDTGVSGAGANPMKILTAMRKGNNPWVQVKHDSLWFAFGFGISCFDIIEATAVALLQFSSQGVVVDIYGDIIAQMPPEAKKREECIVYVELLMNAELNFIYDYFFVQAALAPTSFLLVPACQLYGGFAAGTWFGHNDHAGDWVFTVGGYHRQFSAPEYYPKPDRLGIAFNLGDNMSIRGEGYFAICPKAVMGGAVIYVQLHVGPVSAHLTAGFDALIEFHPLHYIIDLYVEVGVSCHVHVLFISFDVNLDIGANLHIEGPEFGGVAHVDFWFFGFDVSFGHHPEPPPPLHLYEFYNVVAKAGPDKSEEGPPPDDKTSSQLDITLKFALEGGAFPRMPKDGQKEPPNAGAGQMWTVRGGEFAFRCSSVFAIGAASIATAQSAAHHDAALETRPEPATYVEKLGNVTPVGAITSYPMRTTISSSTLHMVIRRVTVQKDGSTSFEYTDTAWRPSYVVKTVPLALWGDPAKKIDPTDPKQAGDKPTVPLAMAMSVLAPPPLLSPSKIGPVNASDIQKQKVGEWHLAKTEGQERFFAEAWKDGKDPNSAALSVTEKIAAWSDTVALWQKCAADNADVAAGMVAECMARLGWDKPPEVTQRIKDEEAKGKKFDRMPWELMPSFPERLVEGTGKADVGDGLVNLYLELPRVVAVA